MKGGVEVAISQRALRAVQRRRLLEALLLGLVLVGLGSAVGWALAGRWLRPLQEMAEASEQVAKGDLVVKIDVQGEDEVGDARPQPERDGRATCASIVDNIQEASVQVASSAGQISANAKLITAGRAGQAQAAEETSTSMEEMAASIQTVAGNAQSLASYVEETSSSITEMGASIEEVARSCGDARRHRDRGVGHHRADDRLDRPDGARPREPGAAPCPRPPPPSRRWRRPSTRWPATPSR